jgi:hypothetical protein
MNNVVAEIITIAKGIEGEGFENIETTAIQELIESHADELTIEELDELVTRSSETKMILKMKCLTLLDRNVTKNL